MNSDLAEEVLRLKRECGAVILAHNYQLPEVQDVADICGDSLELSRAAEKTRAGTIVFCGVDFMAQTAKILNPEKKVLVPAPEAYCPMAALLSPEDIRKARKAHPKAAVMLYVNTSAACKAEADYACTSANAVQVAKAIPQKEIIFGPDENLCDYVRERVPGKKIIPVPAKANCPTHQRIGLADLLELKRKHPGAKAIAHPECVKAVRDASDFLASTSGMLRLIREHGADGWIIATERGMLHRLEKELPGKKFYITDVTCPNMKKTTLAKVRDCLKNRSGEVVLPEEVAERARKGIGRMLEIV
jgi:quinolinate synthase